MKESRKYIRMNKALSSTSSMKTSLDAIGYEFCKQHADNGTSGYGVYVVAFSYPVVPKGRARIRTQVCASHTKEDIDFVIQCLKESRDEIEK